jgi:hypothetical protein
VGVVGELGVVGVVGVVEVVKRSGSAEIAESHPIRPRNHSRSEKNRDKLATNG